MLATLIYRAVAAATTNKILTPEGKEVVAFSNGLDPLTFSETHEDGVRFHAEFRAFLRKKSKPLTVSECTVAHYALAAVPDFTLDANAASDGNIESYLPWRHRFNEGLIGHLVCEQIRRQLKGEKGLLLTDGMENLFYTRSRVVHAKWDRWEWDVDTWKHGERNWKPGCRVFTPAH